MKPVLSFLLYAFLSLALVSPALSQQDVETRRGFHDAVNCALLTNPVTDAIICLQTQDSATRSRGTLYTWNGTAWAEYLSGSGLSSLGGLTGATQTFADDTNVTMSSAGSTHSLGWTGQLAVTRGGTGSGTASDARTALGLAIGSDVQAFNNNLSALASESGTGLWRITGPGTGEVVDGAIHADFDDDDHSAINVKYESTAGSPVAGSCDRDGQLQFDTTASIVFPCFANGGNPKDPAEWNTSVVQFSFGGDSETYTNRNYSGAVAFDSTTADITGSVTKSGSLPNEVIAIDLAAAAKLKTKSITFLVFPKTGSVLADTDDQPTVWRNNIAAMTITEVWCESNAGTPLINLQRDDGSAANVLSSNLSCTTAGATGSIAAAEDNFAVGDKLDFVMVTAGGVAERVTVSIKATLD